MSNHAPAPTSAQAPASSTQSVHAGEERFRAHHSLTVPIVQTAVYTFDTTADLLAFTEERMFWDEPEREEYGRYGNPTVRAVEAKLAALEGAQDAVLVASGAGLDRFDEQLIDLGLGTDVVRHRHATKAGPFGAHRSVLR